MNALAQEALRSVFVTERDFWCRTCNQPGTLARCPYTGEGIALHPSPLCADPFPEPSDEEKAELAELGIVPPTIVRSPR